MYVHDCPYKSYLRRKGCREGVQEINVSKLNEKRYVVVAVVKMTYKELEQKCSEFFGKTYPSEPQNHQRRKYRCRKKKKCVLLVVVLQTQLNPSL